MKFTKNVPRENGIYWTTLDKKTAQIAELCESEDFGRVIAIGPNYYSLLSKFYFGSRIETPEVEVCDD